jgi:hypothetical protein
MGSMGERRRRRTRSDQGGRRRNVEDGFPTYEHNQYTFEGHIERLGGFARGVNRATGWKRAVGLGLTLLVLVPFAIGVVYEIILLVSH